MERFQQRDDLIVAVGSFSVAMLLGNLESGFVRGRAVAAEEHPVHSRNATQPLGQLRLGGS